MRPALEVASYVAMPLSFGGAGGALGMAANAFFNGDEYALEWLCAAAWSLFIAIVLRAHVTATDDTLHKQRLAELDRCIKLLKRGSQR